MSVNLVQINKQDYLQWGILDEHLPALVTFLDSIGVHVSDIPKTPKKRRRKNSRRNKLQKEKSNENLQLG